LIEANATIRMVADGALAAGFVSDGRLDLSQMRRLQAGAIPLLLARHLRDFHQIVVGTTCRVCDMRVAA
jgi:hypothetical protein